MEQEIKIGNKLIGEHSQTFIIAELSANHNHCITRAKDIMKAAKEAGADAVKLQTYTPDTITFNSNDDAFRVDGTIWQGKNLYELYQEAYLPWEWHEELMSEANSLGLEIFSTPFDFTAVNFLEKLNVPAYKIASSELVDLPLIRKVAQTGKPIIISTGMGSYDEINEAVQTVNDAGGNEIILLKCTAAYPASVKDANLRTLASMRKEFGVKVGLSDHTMGSDVAVSAVALGACVVEKHLTLSRSDGGPDAEFSMEPNEFKEMVKRIRICEASLGTVTYQPSDKEKISRKFRKSIFVIQNIKAGDFITEDNIRCIRPANGLHPRYYYDVLNRTVKTNISAGSPLTWDCLQ